MGAATAGGMAAWRMAGLNEGDSKLGHRHYHGKCHWLALSSPCLCSLMARRVADRALGAGITENSINA